ncbi:MAG TPA: KTSC domain-containing protein [Chthoniobacterales bacterium]|jgi:hypothetical protein
MSWKRSAIFIALTVALTAICPFAISIAAEPAVIRSHIPHEPLASAAIATAGYSKRLHIMEIEFCNGAVYRYLDVPPAVYRDFISAESKARYYDWNIKGRYRSLRLRAIVDSASR